MTVDVEDWFNILDSSAAPPLSQWESLESRLEKPVHLLLDLFERNQVKATWFWLGWFAERHPELVCQCRDAGHEIGCHGYAHILAYQVGRKAFGEDISRGKKILEDISGKKVESFRAAGFSVTKDTDWTFEEIRQAGFLYDSSVFPTTRGHGGICSAPLSPYPIQTQWGTLLEFPQSVVEIFHKRLSLFGGGYLRLFPLFLIRKGIQSLEKHHRPLVIYVHPREVDPDHPRLRLSAWRNFKCYCRLKTTYPKLDYLTSEFRFSSLRDYMENHGPFFHQSGEIATVATKKET